MSLKIRRGTNVERLTITPAEGELIYTTDTKNLYIGDGTTAGGKFITGVGYSGSAGIGYTGSAGSGYTGSAGINGIDGSVGYTGSFPSGPAGYVGSFTGSLYNNNNSVIIDGSTGNITTKTIYGLLDQEIEVKTNNTSILSFIGITSGSPGGGNARINIQAQKGTILDPQTTVAGDVLSSIVFRAYTGSSYKPAVTIISAWESDATLTNALPSSRLRIATQNNTNANYFEFKANGEFQAPKFKATGYPTGSLPTADATNEGWIVFDSTTKEFKGWNGSAWVILG